MGWLQAQLAACSLPRAPRCLWDVLGTSCPALGSHRHGAGRRGSDSLQFSHPDPPAPGKGNLPQLRHRRFVCHVHSCFACRGQEREQDLTRSSEVVVTPHNPFTGQHPAAQILGRSSRRQGRCFPDQGTVSKCPAASCPGNCRQDDLRWTEGAWAQGSASPTPAGTACHPRASLIEVSGLVGDRLEVFGE